MVRDCRGIYVLAVSVVPETVTLQAVTPTQVVVQLGDAPTWQMTSQTEVVVVEQLELELDWELA